MEFFEKAHVTKSRKIPHKSKKSEENMKNQLKKMLYGYHQSDNDIIKRSAAVENDFDESSSVSGYSDLNITNSSAEADLSLGLHLSDPDLSLKSQEIDPKSPDLDKSGDIVDSGEDSDNSLSMESIEFEKEAKLPNKSILRDLDGLNSEESQDEATSSDSFIMTSTDLDSNSDDCSDFDADGELAAKILDKINKTKKVTEKSRKRKIVDQPCNEEVSKTGYKGPYRPKTDDEDDKKVDRLSKEMADIRLPKTIQDKTSESEIESVDNTLDDNSIDSVDPSSPFVTVTASDMDSQTLEDILGEYRHPTVRNLPTESILMNTNSGLFETENVSVVDIQTEEDVDSLIPEIDADISIEDIEQNLEDTDTSLQPNEETTEYDTTLQSEDVERESTDSIDHTLESPVKVYYGKHNTCVFVMKHPTEFYIHGKVKVRCIGGNVEIMGHTLQDRIYEVYAPNYNYAQYLRTLENKNACYGLFGKLTRTGLSVATAEEIVTTLGEYDSVVVLQPLKTRQMEFVEQNFTVTDLFSKQNKNIDNYFKTASQTLRCSLYLSQPWKSFEENVIWKQVIQHGLKDQSKGIVCGGKGTGKSTFLRYYVNKHLAKGPVLAIDLDPGQSEFTVPGNVSATVVTEPLLGPSFTHLRTPDISLHLGMINTMDNPSRYVNAVQQLIAHCYNDDRLRSLPWIVNTMGMTNAMGLKFITLVILHTKPTFLLQIDSKKVKNRFEFNLNPIILKNLYYENFHRDRLFRGINEVELEYSYFLSHHGDSTVKNDYSLAPRDERYLSYLAYFGEMLNDRSEDLLGIVPYEVNLKDLNIGLNVNIGEESVTKVINGKVVALCQHTPARRLFTLADTPLTCVGAGVVRGVDQERGLLYIVTPAAAGADTLVYADWTPELRGRTLLAPAGQPLPYRARSDYTQRRHTTAPRRRFNPLQLLKMTRSS